MNTNVPFLRALSMILLMYMNSCKRRASTDFTMFKLHLTLVKFFVHTLFQLEDDEHITFFLYHFLAYFFISDYLKETVLLSTKYNTKVRFLFFGIVLYALMIYRKEIPNGWAHTYIYVCIYKIVILLSLMLILIEWYREMSRVQMYF